MFVAFYQGKYFVHAFFQNGVGAEYAGVALQRALQFAAQHVHVFAAGLAVQPCQALFGERTGVFGQRFDVGILLDELNHAVAGRFAEHHQVEQGVGAEAVGTVH